MTTVFRLVLRAQLTPGRLLGMGALGLLAIGIALAIAAGDPADGRLRAGIDLVDAFGLTLLVPVGTLVFAAPALGEPAEEGTLVYLWLRPIARWRIAAGAFLATLVAALPLVAVPLIAAAAIVGGGGDLVLGTAAATVAGVAAYAGLFVGLGLRVRRALVWGLAYVLVWEGFVALAGATPARLAVRSYTRTLLTRIADGPADLAQVSLGAAVVVPGLVAVLAVAWTAWRLARQEVA